MSNNKIFFYREYEGTKGIKKFSLIVPKKGEDFNGTQYYFSEHSLRFLFFKKLEEVEENEIEPFLEFQLSKFDGGDLQWIDYVQNSIKNYQIEADRKRHKNTEPGNKVIQIIKFDFLANKSVKYQFIKRWLDKKVKRIHTNRKQKGARKQSLNFGWEGTDEQLGYLFRELTRTIIFIDDTKTAKEDFINVMKEDWANHDSKVYWSCETLQLAYFLYKIRYLFHSFTNINIERSGKFESKQGNIIKANNLSKQRSVIRQGIPVKKEQEIDKIIKNLQKEE